jgi:hypothetical protein
MRFHVEQPLSVSRNVAEEALVDPDFYASMGAMSKIGTPEVLSRRDDGSTVTVAVRYRFTGSLAPPARAVLDPAKMTWVIESTMRRDNHTVAFRMVPDHYGDRLECSGTYHFVERGDDAATQVIEGDVIVHVPIVGRAVERAILMGLREHMAEESELVARWAASRA